MHCLWRSRKDFKGETDKCQNLIVYNPKTLSSLSRKDPFRFCEDILSDDKLYMTVFQVRETGNGLPTIVLLIRCLHKVFVTANGQHPSLSHAISIYKSLARDHVALSFLANPELGVVDALSALALIVQNDQILECLNDIAKLSKANAFCYKSNRGFLSSLVEKIMLRDKQGLGMNLEVLSSLCDSPLNCREIQSFPNFESFIRSLISSLGRNELEYHAIANTLIIISRLTGHLSTGVEFFSDVNIAETVKMIFSVLSKGCSGKDVNLSIELLDQLCQQNQQSVIKHLSSTSLIKASVRKLSADPTSISHAIQLLRTLVKHEICKNLVISLVAETKIFAATIESLKSIIQADTTVGQKFLDMTEPLGFAENLLQAAPIELEVEFMSLLTLLVEFLDSLLGKDDVSSNQSYILPIISSSSDLLYRIIKELKIPEKEMKTFVNRIRTLYTKVSRQKVEEKCVSWLIVPFASILVKLHSDNIDELKQLDIVNGKLHKCIQLCLGTCPFPFLVKMAVELSELWPQDFPLAQLIAQENRFRLFQYYSRVASEASQWSGKRREYSMGRPSTSFGLDFQVLDGLSSFRVDMPNDLSFRVEDADRSITALSQLEKEVEFMEHRMKKEVEASIIYGPNIVTNSWQLKTAIAERKISAFEIKISALKSDLVETKDALALKSDALQRKTKELAEKEEKYSKISGKKDRDNELLRREVEQLKVDFKEATEKSKLLDIQTKKLQENVSTLQVRNNENERRLHENKEKMDDLSACLAATRVEKDSAIQTLKSQLESATELSKRKEKEKSVLAAAKDARILELERRVKELEDEGRMHEDIVSKLAESLNGLSMRRRPTNA
ncbi:hypothetical protein HDU97_004049 [Phlyctochytrium planicorne]|nr:hypothetical protein HDU97_004049 [Phlyctochytrium planicorne]